VKNIRFLSVFVFLALLCGQSSAVFAFNGHRVTEGPLTLTIGDIATVTNFDAPQPVNITLSNSSDAPLDVTLQMKGLADDCRAVGETKRRVTVPAKGNATAEFQFACGRGTYSALYPVHVEARFGSVTAHAVQIFETKLPVEAKPMEFSVNNVPASGVFLLTNLKTHRVAWSYIGGPLVHLPPGWSGSDATSAAHFSRAPVTRGDETRQALQMHPAYRPRAGAVFAEYRLKLPSVTPIRFTFYNAIRDSTPKEGKSDGVTFRVWSGDEKLFERHTDSKTWLPGEADLSAFAGKEIFLRLESHPGPKNNTSCDFCYWGDPVIFVGPQPKVLTDAERQELFARARRALAGGKESFVFNLGGGCRAVFVPGPNGITDGVIGFGDGERNVFCNGLQITVNDQPVSGAKSVLRTRIWSDGPALRIKVESRQRITSLGAAAFDQKATRVYYGHGYCIVEPEAFRAGAGGHNLATSHVACDFERGVSLLTATDTPPDAFVVNPATRVYQLLTHPDATLTFVPSFTGAFDAALKYRPLSDKRASPGFARKAGRFVFDIWGGRYADDTEKLARCFDYGLTNSLVMMHVWQRWGYDYRLPNIFPPLPSLGTTEELRELGRVCSARGALWGLHDNYIDFYPDADDFSYDHITFTADGKPRRAWLNEGREAQSYQFRPDHVMPFLKRNLDLIVPALKPTASFVDVFTSISSMDFYDRHGKLHSKRETQRCWGEAFALLERRCGPSVSEAGGDHLVGWLSGADCQFLQLGTKPERFHNVIACRDWSRVPWFDAVNHTRFSLHGVGYSDRYQGGLSREEHGIESDDYISAELLTGHALMIDLHGFTRGAVRKHWLAQDFIESIARDEIAGVEYAGSDIHRLIVTWKSGAKVWVNRSETDWDIGDVGRLCESASGAKESPTHRVGLQHIRHVLPQYGYFAKNGATESSIERFGNAIAEQSRAKGKFYVNSRVFNPNAPLAITPRAERVESVGDRKFRLYVNWNTQQPAPRDFGVFYHFSRPTPGRRALTEFTGGGTPKPATSQWRGDVLTGANWTINIPTNMPLGEYEILVGLIDHKNRGARQRLLGDEDSRRRYHIGKLIVAADNVRLETPAQEFTPSTRWLANTASVDFGVAKTDGAFRCEAFRDHLIVTPLPDGDDFTVRLPLDNAKSVEAIDAKGAVTRTAPFKMEGRELKFTSTKTDFAYRVRLK
jgi:hypothetical protein